MAKLQDAELLTQDLGNRGLKQMRTGMRTEATSVENSVVPLSSTQWNDYVERFKSSPDRYRNTSLFGFKGRGEDRYYYVAVGDHAKQFGSVRSITGEMKYDYDFYWGAVINSQLLKALPNGHSNIVVGIAHPTKSIGQRREMLMATGGRHSVILPNGKEVGFFVREAVPWDEPVGGIIRWCEGLEASYNSLDLRPGSMLLVVDIGGGITSFTHVFVERDDRGKLVFNPVYDQTRSPSIDIGIRNVMDRLRIELVQNHPKFKGMKHINDDMLERGIAEGFINISGEDVDVAKFVRIAESELTDKIAGVYTQHLDSGRPYQGIICTGGGMHSYFERLKSHMWGHKSVFSAGDLRQIHFANLFGGDEIFRQWIERKKGLSGGSTK